MKKILAILAFIPLFAIADLSIEQLGPNVVVVSGTGNGEYPAVVITNVIGYCTNCVAASPQQIRDARDNVESLAMDIIGLSGYLETTCDSLQSQISARDADVLKFYRTPDDTGDVRT